MDKLIALIPIIPLVGFLLNGLLGRWLTRRLSGVIACLSVFISFVFSCVSFYMLVQLPSSERTIETTVYTWIKAGHFSVDIGFQLDPLSAVMILVVSGVGFLIHVYSIGYMSHEASFARYFAFLNLFTFAMLVLVLANNFLLMFVGWEGVGLCSYLLIGFWYTKQSASDAGKKAFIVNRIGDFGFILGMIAIFAVFNSLDFTDVFSSVHKHESFLQQEYLLGMTFITLITLALFLGATGKSAQIPLYVWLPDAMEGPTPVSALIHAATMVTAGVYMIARCHVLFLLSGTSLQVVAVVGALTALFAATIGLVQNDIKRVLAYSTVSQLGYMFLACGVAAFGAGIFHLMTHAFFKALLFLGAGSVIHAMSGEQDIRKMGGIRRKVPVTFAVFLVATLAISGVPGLSGFFSKDEILWYAYAGIWNRGFSSFLWLIGVITAGITAFYMFRLLFMTFTGKTRAEETTYDHVHESPRVMLVPLVILAICAVLGGYVGIPEILGGHNMFHHFLGPVFEESAVAMTPAPDKIITHSVEWIFMLLSVLVASGGILLAAVMYYWKTDIPQKLAAQFPSIYRLVLEKYRIDELYNAIIIKPVRLVSDKILWKICDERMIDGMVNDFARVFQESGALVRLLENGIIHRYAGALVVGLIGFLVYTLTVIY